MISAAVSVAFAALAFAPSTEAHGTLVLPAITPTGTAYAGDYSALVPMNSLQPVGGNKFTHYPDATLNANAFGDAFVASEYTTLRDFILRNQDLSLGRFSNPKTPECGFTDPNSGGVQPLPDRLEWYGGAMNHPGPCEVWCDDEVVIPFTKNCQVAFPDGKMNYDKAKCQGKNRLTLYWMSTLLEWQVYIDCVKIGATA